MRGDINILSTINNMQNIDKKIRAVYDEWDIKKENYRLHTPEENKAVGEEYRDKLEELFAEKRELNKVTYE
jgi:hypothetical protein